MMTNDVSQDPPYRVRDPQPARRENPYTFFVPDDAELAEVSNGQLVKLMIAGAHPDRKYDAERMWVTVTHRDGEILTGQLDNDPLDIVGLQLGDDISFRLSDIISIIWADPAQATQYAKDQDRWFARCFVDDPILDGTARVGYIYREAPEHRETDAHVDTGWRIRADVDQLTDEEYERESFSYVAIGAVLNKDDSFLDMLSSPVGSAFQRGEGDTYLPVNAGDDD